MKKDEYTWGGETEDEETINNLCAVAVLACLHNKLDERYVDRLAEFVEKAEKKYVSDKQFLLPFVLGLYATFRQFNTKSEVCDKLQNVLAKGEKETRLPFSVEYLFVVSFFYDLLEPDSEKKDFKIVRDEATELARKISSSFADIPNNDEKVKLLYSLVALSLGDELRSLYEGSKKDIEKLAETTKLEDIKALLLRVHMALNVHCSRTIVFEIIDYFKKNSFGIEERKIRQRLSNFFLYLGNKPAGDVDVKKKGKNYYLTIELDEDSILELQKQIPAIPFVASIALSLCNSGFKRICTVPMQEIEQYREFMKSKETELYTRVDKKGLAILIDDAVSKTYSIAVIKGIVLFLLSVSLSVAIFLTYSQIYSILPPVLELIILEILGVVFPSISESGYALLSTVARRKSRKVAIRKEFEGKLKKQ